MSATHPYIPRISVVFDFDSTLATDTFDALVGCLGLSRKEFDERYVEPLGDGWDGIIRRGFALLEAADDVGEPLTEELIARAAKSVRIFDGALEMPDRLRGLARELDAELELEFVVLSSGYAEIIKATGIGEAFDRVWAGTFAFRDGRAFAVKRIVSHFAKALYLEALAKGIDVNGSNGPEQASSHVAMSDMHTPLDQMIYLGDGLSDLNAFGFLASHGGLCIAIDKDEHFDHEDAMDETQRVDNLAGPSYAEGSELLTSLEHAVRAAASRVALRRLSRGE